MGFLSKLFRKAKKFVKRVVAPVAMVIGIATGNPLLAAAGAAASGRGKPIQRISRAALAATGATLVVAGKAAYAGFASSSAKATLGQKLAAAAGAAKGAVSTGATATALKWGSRTLMATSLAGMATVKAPKISETAPENRISLIRPEIKPKASLLTGALNAGADLTGTAPKRRRRAFQKYGSTLGEPPLAFRPEVKTLLGA